MTSMRIFLIGVSCVGKTAVGKELAALRGVPFFDLDHEIERFFKRPIPRLQAEFLTMHSFRKEAAKALTTKARSSRSISTSGRDSVKPFSLPSRRGYPAGLLRARLRRRRDAEDQDEK
jgi:shikimate kinase